MTEEIFGPVLPI